MRFALRAKSLAAGTKGTPRDGLGTSTNAGLYANETAHPKLQLGLLVLGLHD
jgi:hypothetical protein